MFIKHIAFNCAMSRRVAQLLKKYTTQLISEKKQLQNKRKERHGNKKPDYTGIHSAAPEAWNAWTESSAVGTTLATCQTANHDNTVDKSLTVHDGL